MGILWSALRKIFTPDINCCEGSQFSFCNEGKFSCCHNRSAAIEDEPGKADTFACEDSVSMVRSNFFLSRHPITRFFFYPKNIGYFTTDIDGTATSVSDNIAEFIGFAKDKLVSTLNWISHVADGQYEELKLWQDAARNEKSYVKKMHFSFDNKDIYTIVEAHPVFSNTKYKGMRGIMIRLPKKHWKEFDEKDFDPIDNRIILID